MTLLSVIVGPRRMLLSCFGFAVACGVAGSPRAMAQATTQQVAGAKPNVIFILADDLGYADIGSYGQAKIKTPNLDALASQGVKFTQAYAGSPVCGPSRSVLLTGQHTGRTPIRGNPAHALNWDKVKQGDPPLPAEGDAAPTLGQIFKKAGYVTAARCRCRLFRQKVAGALLQGASFGNGSDRYR